MTTGPVVRKVGDYQAHPTGETLDLNQLRENAWLNASVNGGQNHYWIVGLIFHVDDPETALDDMVLNEHNLVGAQGIYCLICLRHYDDGQPGELCHGLRKAEEVSTT